MEDTKTKKVWKIAGIALSIMLGSFALLTLVSNASEAQSTTQANLETIHKELVQVETLLSQGKADEVRLRTELDASVSANNVLREKREALIMQSNEIINAPLGL